MTIQTNPPAHPARRITFFGGLLIVIVLLIVANLAVISIKALAKPAQTTPGTLLYATQFKDANDKDWYQYAGALSTQITNGTLLISADTAKDGTYSDLNYDLNDFDIRVVTREMLGDDPYGEYGVLFRYRDRNNYYMLKVRADGAYHIVRSVNGKVEDLSAPHTSPAILPGVNHVNDLRVVGQADHFQFYINGQPLTLCPKGTDKFSTWNGDQCLSNNKQTSQDLIDSTFPDGRLALGVYENETKIQVAFSNVLIYSPSASPAAQ